MPELSAARFLFCEYPPIRGENSIRYHSLFALTAKVWLPQRNHKHCNFPQVAVKRADRTRAEALGQTPRSRGGRSLGMHGRPHGAGRQAGTHGQHRARVAVVAYACTAGLMAPGGRQVDTVNTALASRS